MTPDSRPLALHRLGLRPGAFCCIGDQHANSIVYRKGMRLLKAPRKRDALTSSPEPAPGRPKPELSEGGRSSNRSCSMMIPRFRKPSCTRRSSIHSSVSRDSSMVTRTRSPGAGVVDGDGVCSSFMMSSSGPLHGITQHNTRKAIAHHLRGHEPIVRWR